ncbi:MAG: 30S ribosomal protein S20 [Thermoleophilia bacterium]|nr:30S ribosomal protein S20 [Thermoleophilia bacterium]
MANIKQQKKRILVAERQRMENIRYRSSIKTAFRRVVEAVQGGDAAVIETAHKDYVSLIDRATAKRALHQNTASRKKARVTRVIARGPQLEETKKRRVTRKTATKAAAKVTEAEAVVVEEVVVEEESAVEAPAEAEATEAPVKKAAAKKPAAKKAAAKPADAEEAPAEDAAEAPDDES